MTDHPKLTLELVRATADEIVKDNPDKTVSLCQYAARDYAGPSCLVGAALFHLGWEYEELQKLDWADTDSGTEVDQLVEAGYLDATVEAANYLDRLQRIQDSGKTWLEAYRYAETYAP